MNQTLPITMTSEEFLQWSVQQDTGRYELEAGRIVAMPSDSIRNTKAHRRIDAALNRAIEGAGVPFYSLPAGPAVVIDGRRAYEPDCLIAPLPEPPEDSLSVDNPVAVVEVLSTWSIRRDLTVKVAGYARVPAIQHYIVVDLGEREVFVFRRRGEVLQPGDAPLRDGDVLRLDPPGLEVQVSDLLGPAPAAADIVEPSTT